MAAISETGSKSSKFRHRRFPEIGYGCDAMRWLRSCSLNADWVTHVEADVVYGSNCFIQTNLDHHGVFIDQRLNTDTQPGTLGFYPSKSRYKIGCIPTSVPLESRTPWIQLRDLGKRCELHQQVRTKAVASFLITFLKVSWYLTSLFSTNIWTFQGWVESYPYPV